MDHTVLLANNTIFAFTHKHSPGGATTHISIANAPVQLTTHLSTPRGWMAELAMLADIQQTVYPEEVTHQLLVTSLNWAFAISQWVGKQACCVLSHRVPCVDVTIVDNYIAWWRGTVARTSVLVNELSLSHARPSADGWPFMCANRPPEVSQPGQLCLSSSRGR